MDNAVLIENRQTQNRRLDRDSNGLVTPKARGPGPGLEVTTNLRPGLLVAISKFGRRPSRHFNFTAVHCYEHVHLSVLNKFLVLKTISKSQA